jgi:hypothetical protein
MRRFSFLLAAGAIMFFGHTSSFAASSVCVEAGDKGYDQIRAIYDPKIDLFLKVVQNLQKMGHDPKKYPAVLPDGTIEDVDMTDLVTRMAVQKSAAANKVREAVDQCNQSLATPQKITDAAVFFATGGLSAILPAKYTHTDIGNILAGKPFGDGNALVPKARDDLLNSLGVSGDVACIIKDPKKIFGGC